MWRTLFLSYIARRCAVLRACAVLFCAIASAAACGSFVRLFWKAESFPHYFGALWRAYVAWGAHAALCALSIVCVSRIALSYSRYAGLALGVAVAAFLLRFGVQLHKEKTIDELAHAVWLLCMCAVVDAALCIMLLPLCTKLGAGVLLLPAALAPFVLPFAALLQKPFAAIKQVWLYRKAQCAMARFDAVTGVVVAGAQDGALCAHILHSVLSQSRLCAAQRVCCDAPSLCKALLSPQMGTTGALIACLPTDDKVQSAHMMRMLSPRVIVFSDDDAAEELQSVIKKLLRFDAAVVCAQEAEHAPEAAVCRTFAVGGSGDMVAESPRFTAEGVRFVLSDRRTGQTVRCILPLIGKRSLTASCAAAAAAHLFNVDRDAIAQSFWQIQPLAGQMATTQKNGALWIDDTQHRGLCDMQYALETLGHMDARHVLILHARQDECADDVEHAKQIGRCAAQSVDVALLVGGTHADAVFAGMLEGGFARENVHFAQDAQEASEKEKTIIAAGDVVLQVSCK